MTEYVVYRGDEVLTIGTASEVAERLGIKPSTVRGYASQSHIRAVSGRDALIAVRVVTGSNA